MELSRQEPDSGEAHGVERIMTRARTIASYGVKFEIIRAVFGFGGGAMILHNTGTSKAKVLDEHLAAVSAEDEAVTVADTGPSHGR